MPNKMKSRKFWIAIVTQVVGVVALVWGTSVANEVSVIAGAVITILASLGYLKTEGDLDKQRAKNGR